MQWMPEYHDFVLDRGILTGIGKFHPIQCCKMQQLCIALQKRAAQSHFSKELLVSQLTVVLENLLHRLEFISMDFRRMQLTVRETQRIFFGINSSSRLPRLLSPRPLTHSTTRTHADVSTYHSKSHGGFYYGSYGVRSLFPGWHPSLAREAILSALYNSREDACTYHPGTRR